MKIVFFGTPKSIDPVITELEKKFDVVEEIREPKQFSNLPAGKAGETIEQFRSLNPDLFVVAAYGKILSSKLLEIPRLGAINIHPSLLPKYRGPSPIQSAILNGDKTTGVTFIKMDEQVDHGPIIYQFEETILQSDTFESLANRLFKKSADVLEDVLTRFKNDQTTPQDESLATFTKIITKQDGFIDISTPPSKQELDAMIRAFHPWPGVWTNYQLQPTRYSLIKFLPQQKLQVEGKKSMSYKDFINGYPKGKFFLEKLSLI